MKLDREIDAVLDTRLATTMLDGEIKLDFECPLDTEIGRVARGFHFPPLFEAPTVEDSLIPPVAGVSRVGTTTPDGDGTLEYVKPLDAPILRVCGAKNAAPFDAWKTTDFAAG
jgi:hypothetical protein